MHIPSRLMAQIDNTQMTSYSVSSVGAGIPVPVGCGRRVNRSEYIALRETDGRPLEELFGDVAQSIRVSLLPSDLGLMRSSCFRTS